MHLVKEKINYYCNSTGVKCPFNNKGLCMTWQDCEYKAESLYTEHEKWYKEMEKRNND